ncbi:MAG: hypothetical protein M3490_12460 [Chloroflexota bacterium]|nr:hypothetical protein [Chloroflexota bacterium]
MMVSEAKDEGHIAFLLGKPLRRESTVADVVEGVHHHWRTVIVHRLSDDGTIPVAVFESKFVIQHGLDERRLAIARRVEDAGIRCMNPISATLKCHNRAAVMSSLSEAGINVPETPVADCCDAVLVMARDPPIVIKTLDGGTGPGVKVLISPSGELPGDPPFHGPFIA